MIVSLRSRIESLHEEISQLNEKNKDLESSQTFPTKSSEEMNDKMVFLEEKNKKLEGQIQNWIVEYNKVVAEKEDLLKKPYNFNLPEKKDNRRRLSIAASSSNSVDIKENVLSASRTSFASMHIDTEEVGGEVIFL